MNDVDSRVRDELWAIAAEAPMRPDLWERTQQRIRVRRRTRTLRLASGAVAAVLVLGALGVVVGHSLSPAKQVLEVGSTGPSQSAALVRPLQVAPVGALNIAPAGPYRAGQLLRVSYKPDPHGGTVANPLGSGVSVCYPWNGGEMCDPTIESRAGGTNAAGIVTFSFTIPGWVYTPTGLQSCEVLACRFEIQRTDAARVGTAPLTIAAGPEPHQRARIVAVQPDAHIELSLDGIVPDLSWIRWSAIAHASSIAKFPPGNISICAFAARLECDQLVQPSPPPFDGHPHVVTVATNRLLFTSAGWIDCAKVVCAIQITRAVDVNSLTSKGFVRNVGRSTESIVRSLSPANGRNVVAGTETIAFVPYQLPPTTPEMRQPALTYTPRGPFHVGDTVTVVLHNPPPNIDADSQLVLSRCSGVNLQLAADCSGPTNQTWSRLADGSLQQQTTLEESDPQYGIYLAVAPRTSASANSGWIARTDPFTVTMTGSNSGG